MIGLFFLPAVYFTNLMYGMAEAANRYSGNCTIIISPYMPRIICARDVGPTVYRTTHDIEGHSEP